MSLFVSLLFAGSFLFSSSLVNGQGLTFLNNMIIVACDANIDAIIFSGGTCGSFALLNNQYALRTCSTTTYQVTPSGSTGNFPTFTFPSNNIITLTQCTTTGFDIYYAPPVNCPSLTDISEFEKNTLPSNMTKVIHVKY